MLAAPAAACGSVCLDKARGHLTLVLATPLRPYEVVAGKLGGRLVAVVTLVLGSLPLLFLATFLGGIAPQALPLAYAVLLAVGVTGCTVALMFSVWVGKPHEALLLTYVCEIAAMLAYPVVWLGAHLELWPAVPTWLERMELFGLVAGEYSNPPPAWEDYGHFFALAFAVTLLATTLATLTLRRADHAGPQLQVPNWWRRFRRTPRTAPPLDRDPMRWYEWHRKRPSRAMAWVLGLYRVGAGLALAIALWVMATDRRIGEELAVTTVAVVAGCGLLILAVQAVTSLADERTRGSLDVLLVTPLTVREILYAKWRRALETYRGVAILATVVAFAGSFGSWLWLNVGPLLVTVALALPVAESIRPVTEWLRDSTLLDPSKMPPALPPPPPGFVGPLPAPPPVVPTPMRQPFSTPPRETAFAAALLTPVLVLGYSMAFASFGLYCAVRCRTLARAMGVQLAVFALVNVGYLFALAVLESPNQSSEHWILGSPWIGTAIMVETAVGDSSYREDQQRTMVQVGCLIALTYTAVAALVYWVTVAVFDRSFDRGTPEKKRMTR